MTILQAVEAGELAKEGIKAVGQIDDPMTKFVLVLLSVLVLGLCWALAYMYRSHNKKSDKERENEKENLKKKDELLIAEREALIDLMKCQFKQQQDFQHSVTDLGANIKELHLILKETNERNKNSYDLMTDKLIEHHNHSVKMVEKIEGVVVRKLDDIEKKIK